MPEIHTQIVFRDVALDLVDVWAWICRVIDCAFAQVSNKRLSSYLWARSTYRRQTFKRVRDVSVDCSAIQVELVLKDVREDLPSQLWW